MALDEPSAGLDPYNRRTIWDLIIAAKKNRSIVLCSHHLEEVDLLSDRVAIMNEGQIVACGSPLFLKHHYGGYSLRFEASDQLDVSKYVAGAVSLPMEKPLHFQWKIEHGSEPYFAELLAKLDEHGAKNVALELTTLEQVFLETSKEEHDLDDTAPSEPATDEGGEQDGVELVFDPNAGDKASWLGKIWEKRGDVAPIGFWTKFFLVQDFMNKNARRQKGSIIINVTFPLFYMVAGLVVVYLVGESDPPTLIEPDVIPITPSALLGDLQNGVFFGVPESTSDFIDPITRVEAPGDIEFFFDDEYAVLGGHWAHNETLQYNPAITPFALQLAEFASSAASLSQNASSTTSLNVFVQQLPFVSEEPFRIDFLLLPIALVFGFTGMVMSILDVLTLKGNNAVSLFRVAGVNEWTIYLGVMYYKCTTTFMPFFVLTMVLSLAFKNVLLGNGGRWLAFTLTLLLFAYSSTPIGLIIGKRFIHRDFDSVKGWFPAAYFTLISLPYLAWNIAYQSLPEAQATLLIVGDFLCLIPPVAFQRSLGAIIQVSLVYDDPNLTWNDVWTFDTRVLLSIVLMFGVGTLEWVYLYRLTTTRPPRTKVEADSDRQPEPIHDEDVLEEKERSAVDDDGINARELVKVFEVEIKQDGKKTRTLKKAVKGVDFGIKKNEIYVLLGPNGRFLHGKEAIYFRTSFMFSHFSMKTFITRRGENISYVHHCFGTHTRTWVCCY
jgi:energy-coupling factor transporter ATP-binding protein EcfA2